MAETCGNCRFFKPAMETDYGRRLLAQANEDAGDKETARELLRPIGRYGDCRWDVPQIDFGAAMLAVELPAELHGTATEAGLLRLARIQQASIWPVTHQNDWCAEWKERG